MASYNRSAASLSGLAVASLVLGLLGGFVFTALLGFILGVVALLKINGSGGRLRGQGIAIGGVLVSGCWLLMLPFMAAILFPVFATAREKAREVNCRTNAEAAGLALLSYAKSHGGNLPPVAVDLDTVLRKQGLPLSALTCPTGAGWAVSPNLAGKCIARVRNPGSTPLLYESEDGQTMAFPHHHSGHVVMVDGTVRLILEHQWMGE